MPPRVSAVSGWWSVRKSAAAYTSSADVGLLDAELAEALGRDERVVGDDAHPEPERAACDLLADAAEAEDAERLVGHLEAGVLRAVPAALLERGVRLRDVAREREQQADRVLGRGDDGRLGRVRDDDPSTRGGIDVDVVHPHSRTADHAQSLGALDQVGGELGLRADDDRVVLADPLGEVAVVVDVDVEALLQQRDARVGDRLLGSRTFKLRCARTSRARG